MRRETGHGDLHPPEAFLGVCARLEEAGFQAWAVGGAIRDALMGRDRADWDLATDARPPQVRGLFPRTVPLGVEHGTVGVIAVDGRMYEVTTFRRDVETDGRHAVVAFADSVDEDLARRDFTINAIAWRPGTDELRDPFGGRDALRAGRLQAVGEAGDRFAEDYLRVLRGLRFAGRLALEIEPATRAALEEAVPGLDRLSAERVREEIAKSLGGPGAGDILRLYAEAGALRHWLPELDDAMREDPRAAESVAAVDEIPPHRGLLRLVRWLLALPRGSAPEGEAADGAPVEAILRRLKFANAEIRTVRRLWEAYLPFLHPADSDARLREWLSEVGREHARDVFRLHFALARARAARESERALLHTWRRVHAELVGGAPVSLSDLAVNGGDLLELGLPAGPLVGLMLEELHARVLEDPSSNDRETLLAEARELIEIGALDGLEEE
ncbi:MAG: CCA tRNA nucleotidyltransferase [Gemmatimonadota bacterium]|nr:CCA tRNA nucleotidyltransferase [Gemmatimonadota bacterium]